MRDRGDAAPGAQADVIAAIATPAGAGGIGVVRVSGSGAREIVARVLRRGPEALPDRRLVYGVAHDREGRVDEVLAVVMEAPRSYTGEEVAEIHGHGGSTNMARLLRAVVAEGARVAAPGEFTRRAFENGRLDLVRAEAVIDVIGAKTELSWRQARAQLEGGLGARIEELRQRALDLLATIEASIDFPEDEPHEVGTESLVEGCGLLADELRRLGASYDRGRAIRDGVDVVVTGPVNAGKSSLFNELLGHERAIVDSEPGTTRDYVEADTIWDGLEVTLVDTAGERDSGEASEIERRGIELGRARGDRARLRLVVHDGADWQRLEPVERSAREVHVISKSDLLPAGWTTPCGMLRTSASRHEGIEQLKHEIVARAIGDGVGLGESVAVSSERQYALLRQAEDSLRRGRELLQSGWESSGEGEKPRAQSRARLPQSSGEDQKPQAQVRARLPQLEVVAVEVREAVMGLGEIMGIHVDDEMLDRVFSRFCIGK